MAGHAAAQEPRRVTLSEALELFARNNLELALARADAAQAEAFARQAAAFPNPTFGATHEPLSAGDEAYSESYFTVSQRFDWPGLLGARRDAAVRMAAAARLRVTADSARLTFELKRTFLEAARAEVAAEMLQRVADVFREAEASAALRYEEGDISLYDRRRIGVERMRYEQRLAEAALDVSAARQRLALLADPSGTEPGLAPVLEASSLPPSIAENVVLEIALSRRGELAAARAALAATRSEVAVARAERMPDPTFTGGYKTQSDGFDGLFMGLSLPLPLWDRRSAAIDAAEARVSAAASRVALVERQVENDVRRTFETYRSLSRRVDLMGGEAAAEAADLLEIARVAYAEGEMELIEMLDAAEALIDAQLVQFRLRADLWTAYYDLERAVGGFDDAPTDTETDR